MTRKINSERNYHGITVAYLKLPIKDHCFWAKYKEPYVKVFVERKETEGNHKKLALYNGKAPKMGEVN